MHILTLERDDISFRQGRIETRQNYAIQARILIIHSLQLRTDRDFESNSVVSTLYFYGSRMYEYNRHLTEH